MVSFREALELLMGNAPVWPVERCRIEEAAGRVLRAPIRADRAFPAFDRVMMDGYALKSADWLAGQRLFRVAAAAPAGHGRVDLPEEAGVCVEVMTGAPCPLGADCIVPVEEAVRKDEKVVGFSATADPVAGRFIHRAGSDAAAADLLLEPGTLLGSREIGVAASCGAAWLDVSRLPTIAVVATGDELVPVHQTPQLYQIRQSNAHSIAAALRRAGYPPGYAGLLGDDEVAARPMIEELLAGHDWLILTGAASKGGRDFVPSLLEEIGCRRVFHGVAQRPGKPAGCWIGMAGQVVMVLPGNPVSALTGLHVFVLPALAVASGLPLPIPRHVVASGRMPALPGFTRHLPVKLRADGRAEAAATGNSGDFIGLLRSDGWITIPPSDGKPVIQAAFPFSPWL